jgi:hypothetical protein
MLRDALLEQDSSIADKVNLKTMGFGDIAPLTCSGTVTGQHVNSRIEVWVKEPLNAG